MTRVRTRERRRPATLRTKTGCHNCRTRKRKCDEQHPTCLACAKRHLSCSWPQEKVQTVGGRPSISLPEEGFQGLAGLALSHGTTDSLLHHYTSRLCAVLLNRHAHPDFARLFLQSSILPKLQHMVEPLLACASLDLSRQFPSHQCYQRLAWAYYAQAVTRTRNIITQKCVQGTENWLLLNVLHLNLFETWSATDARDADANDGTDMKNRTPVLLHIQGAAQILKLKLQGTSDPDSTKGSGRQPHRDVLPRSTSDMVVTRIAAEAFVYHTVNWSMFFLFHGNNSSHNFQSSFMPTPDAELWDGLQPYLELRPFPDASGAQNSPVLGVPWQLYRFFSDLAILRKQSTREASALDNLSKSLDSWEDEKDTRTRLFVLALRLLLLKFQQPSLTTRDARVQLLVSEATDLLHDTHVERTDFWPLLIVGSAAVNPQQIALLRATLQTIALTMHSVAFAKTKLALEAIWADTKNDGLTMLLGGGGSGVPS
ncbi:hypothetical protein SEUCBS140593_008456 [Sporothrix eucalyptigena]|uniref:Zn(2)-C6 fungal-type domain-containing protein n=1 Tax=Sporothrix eucalyptigena TaxID=1812306 RepID=A0ABP0CLN8_9PEZI